MTPRSLAAIIMAAGQGKRMKNPDMAKVMHTLDGLPLVQHVVRLARAAGAERIIVIVGHQRHSVIEYLRAAEPDVEFAVQEQQLGTGHAVQQAIPLLRDFDGDILILSGDAPMTRVRTVRDAIELHLDAGADATVLTAVLPDPTGYGRVLRDEAGRIVRIVEHKDASDEERGVREINSGMYVFRKDALFDALARITNDNAQGEYYLPDVFAIFAREHRVMLPCVVDSFDELRGVNTVEQLQELELLYAALRREERN
ncbi:MAG TPA: sugar phosphate nucleotidyltransferase [Bacteroidota bacterium]|nr:sugar phosphate nucleotidyltransferase [Bacteroidota bacterium]